MTKEWIVRSGHKSCEEHYKNDYKVAWRVAEFVVYSNKKPVFELIAVPGGNGVKDSIDIYNCGYEVDLIIQDGAWWDEGTYDQDESTESCYLWNFTVEELTE